jgi:hypothetical protein
MYMLHFLAALLAGFALWMTNRPLFRKFAITFVLVAVAGFAIYIIYLAVPPWMAAQPLIHVHNLYKVPYVYAHGQWIPDVTRGQIYLPGVRSLFNVMTSNSSWFNPYHGTIAFGKPHLQYDRVATIPSEHAMYPLLFLLFLRKQFGSIAFLASIYIAALLFSITYMGQHCVVDPVAGFAYALAGYDVVMHGAPALRRRWMTRMHRALAPAHGLALPELEEV